MYRRFNESYHSCRISTHRHIKELWESGTAVLISMTARLAKQIVKFSTPLLLLICLGLTCSALTWFICSQYLTMRLDFSQAFESTIQPPPTKDNSKGLSVQINGVDGGKAIFGFVMPQIIRRDSGEVEFIEGESISEKLALTPRKQEEIEENLSQLDPQKWQVLTELPSPIFRYNLDLISNQESLNSAKKQSYFLVAVARHNAQRVMPGQEYALGRNLEIGDISRRLAATKIDLVYGTGVMGMYMNFYDKRGEFISQATGTLVITPTVWTKGAVFVGWGLLLLVLITLLLRILLIPKNFKEAIDYYKR
jgi:hypothetical protein